jgi:hypothetical protein
MDYMLLLSPALNAQIGTDLQRLWRESTVGYDSVS